MWITMYIPKQARVIRCKRFNIKIDDARATREKLQVSLRGCWIPFEAICELQFPISHRRSRRSWRWWRTALRVQPSYQSRDTEQIQNPAGGDEDNSGAGYGNGERSRALVVKFPCRRYCWGHNCRGLAWRRCLERRERHPENQLCRKPTRRAQRRAQLSNEFGLSSRRQVSACSWRRHPTKTTGERG